MIPVLKVASVLLSYPSALLQREAAELSAALAADVTLGDLERACLGRVIDALAGRDLIDAQEHYVSLFDRSRSLSLHLFEHVHGESRDRGQAMVELRELYQQSGWQMADGELPDYLPVFLEFLAHGSVDEGRELLSRVAPILSLLRQRLTQRDSVYAGVFEVLESLAMQEGAPAGAGRRLDDGVDDDAEEDIDDPAYLDRVWEEEAVSFGGNLGDASCGTDRLIRQARAAVRRPDMPSGVRGVAHGPALEE